MPILIESRFLYWVYYLNWMKWASKADGLQKWASKADGPALVASLVPLTSS